MARPAASPPLSANFAAAAQAIAHRMSGGQGSVVALSPSVTDLVYRGSRYWGLAQARCSRLAKQAPDLTILALLAVSWAALDQNLREPHVVVDEAVAAAKRLAQVAGRSTAAQKISGFVNALLRASLSDPAASTKDHQTPTARWNAPAWWIEYHLSLQGFIEQLREKGLNGYQVGRRAVVIEPAVPVKKIPGFSEGWVSVQDSAAQHVIDLAQDLYQRIGRPLKILDACAAPGGKTFALAQSLQAKIWAMDVSASRMKRMQADWARVAPAAQSSVTFLPMDVLDDHAWESHPTLPNAFDLILLDAPCTGSGITRRRPEIAWRRDQASLEAVVDTQRRLLDTLWRKLPPGGELIFVTCSVLLAEGEAQESAFLSRTPDARRRPSPGRILPATNAEFGTDQDGFFYARFEKQKHDGPDTGDGRHRPADSGPGRAR
jgi:16S rRNA (cytosine967-C5)-methyltransferase